MKSDFDIIAGRAQTTGREGVVRREQLPYRIFLSISKGMHDATRQNWTHNNAAQREKNKIG